MRLTDLQLNDLGVQSAIAHAAVAEIREHRAVMARLEEWAVQLEQDTTATGVSGVGRFIAAELRNRIKGAK